MFPVPIYNGKLARYFTSFLKSLLTKRTTDSRSLSAHNMMIRIHIITKLLTVKATFLFLLLKIASFFIHTKVIFT